MLTSRISIAAAPEVPSKAAAADGAGSPALTSDGNRGRMPGSLRNATAASPRVVANVNGIENQALQLSELLVKYNPEDFLPSSHSQVPPRDKL